MDKAVKSPHAKTLAALMVALNERRLEMDGRTGAHPPMRVLLWNDLDKATPEDLDPACKDPVEMAIIKAIRKLGKSIFEEGGIHLMTATVDEMEGILGGGLGAWAAQVVDHRWEGIGGQWYP